MKLPSYPSTLRNRVFISNVLGFYLPKNGCILETASGTGEHLCFFSEEFPLCIGSLQINHRICFGRFVKEAKTRKISRSNFY